MSLEFFDYTTLRFIWWLLLGILLIGFAVMDGFDLGVGALLPFVAKNDSEKRVTLNTIGPVWEGNQVWLILGGGAIFAAWPAVYAVSFSGFYFAMLLVLFGLILRPVGFKYRGKIQHPTWKKAVDIALFLGGFIPALLFGVAVGNVIEGVPFHFDDTLRMFYTGSFWALLNPFALLSGLVSLSMLVLHGGTYLAIKTEDLIQKRAIAYAQIAAVVFIILFAVAGYCIVNHITSYTLSVPMLTDGPSNPLHKSVSTLVGGWISNYQTYPILILVPACSFICAFLAIILLRFRAYHLAWMSSAFVSASTIGTVGVSMFPFILPSSSNPNESLMLWDASSSETTLGIMLVAAIIFVPIILAYTSWVYYVLRGKVTASYIEENSKDVY
jgi:cytochrome bd ubiquinol oxidase subunit II